MNEKIYSTVGLRIKIRRAFEHTYLLTDRDMGFLGTIWGYEAKGRRLTNPQQERLDSIMAKVELGEEVSA